MIEIKCTETEKEMLLKCMAESTECIFSGCINNCEKHIEKNIFWRNTDIEKLQSDTVLLQDIQNIINNADDIIAKQYGAVIVEGYKDIFDIIKEKLDTQKSTIHN